jgi:elongation factor Ts
VRSRKRAVTSTRRSSYSERKGSPPSPSAPSARPIRVGVLVEVNSETDFVANTAEFKQLVKDIALHIASPAAPRWLRRDDVPADVVQQEEHIALAQAKEAGKPENVLDRIVEGKLNAFYQGSVLLEQPYVKDDAKTIQQLLDEVAAKVGEKVAVRRFVRYKLGESTEA